MKDTQITLLRLTALQMILDLHKKSPPSDDAGFEAILRQADAAHEYIMQDMEEENAGEIISLRPVH